MMPIAARRVFRLSVTVALTLAVAYGMRMSMPYVAPIFAIFLTLAPKPPMGIKGLFGVVIFVTITTGVGLLLVPLLTHFPASALLIAFAGLYLSNYLSVNLGKAPVGAFLTIGITLISAAGYASYTLADTVIEAIALGIALAIVCQWIVYPFFPEDAGPAAGKAPAPPAGTSNWIALRATLIVLPTYLMALTNPAMYMAVVMKSVSLGQQSSILNMRSAGRELLGSTFLGGTFAILVWLGLGMGVSLWMFFLWVLLVTVYFASKIYGLLKTRFPASFWTNTGVTMLILLGSAVQDSATGKDVYKAFAIRMALFVVVTLYAWAAVLLLEHLRVRRLNRRTRVMPVTEVS